MAECIVPGRNDEPKQVRTSDLFFASYLRTCEIPLVNAEVSGAGEHGRSRKITFVFNLSQSEYDKHKGLFFSGSGMVSAGKFTQVLRAMKQLISVTSSQED